MSNLTRRSSLISTVSATDGTGRQFSGYGRWIAAMLLVVAPCCAWGQQGAPPDPAHDTPRPADLEPGVNTSATPPPEAVEPAPVAPSTQPKPAAAAASSGNSTTVPSKADTPASASRSGADMRQAKSTAPKSGNPSVSPKGDKGSGGKAQDHLQLDTTQITGNQELPKVLYIVPWKRSDLGDLLGKPANSLIDEVLQPVDRDVFKRENRYYDALKPDAGGAADKAAGAADQAAGSKR
jgi:hypothetical protein